MALAIFALSLQLRIDKLNELLWEMRTQLREKEAENERLTDRIIEIEKEVEGARMIRTVYITKIYWEREYDDQEKEECLHDDLGKALVWLAKKGFTKMKLHDGNGRYEPFVCFEQGEHSAYIEVNTGDWVTAKEAKERGLDWE